MLITDIDVGLNTSTKLITFTGLFFKHPSPGPGAKQVKLCVNFKQSNNLCKVRAE